MNSRIIHRLHETLDAAGKIQRWMSGLDMPVFMNDDLLQSGIERQFEIIGESLRVVRHNWPQSERVFPQYTDG